MNTEKTQYTYAANYLEPHPSGDCREGMNDVEPLEAKRRRGVQMTIRNLDGEGNVRAFRLACKKLTLTSSPDAGLLNIEINEACSEIEFDGYEVDGQTVAVAVFDIFDVDVAGVA